MSVHPRFTPICNTVSWIHVFKLIGPVASFNYICAFSVTINSYTTTVYFESINVFKMYASYMVVFENKHVVISKKSLCDLLWINVHTVYITHHSTFLHGAIVTYQLQ